MKVSGSVINVEVDGIGTWTLDPKDVGYLLAGIEPQKVSGVLSSTQYSDLSGPGTGVKVTIPGNNYPYVAIVWQVENMLSDITKKAALWMPIQNMYRLTQVNEGTNEVLDSMRIWANVSPVGKMMVMRSGLNKGSVYEIESWDTVTKIYKLKGKRAVYIPFTILGNGYNGTYVNTRFSYGTISGDVIYYTKMDWGWQGLKTELGYLVSSGQMAWNATYEFVSYSLGTDPERRAWPVAVGFSQGNIEAVTATMDIIRRVSSTQVLKSNDPWFMLWNYSWGGYLPKTLEFHGGISAYYKYFVGFQVRDLYQIFDLITNEYLEDIYPDA
jgi:hypothetical protein